MPQRHNLALLNKQIPLRNYSAHLAPVQLQLFEIWTAQPDPRARLDGNVCFTDKAKFEGENPEFEVITNDWLHVSGVRNA